MTDELTRISYHEAAHCLAFLDHGVRVRRLTANLSGGACEPAAELDAIDDRTMQFATLAGAKGVNLLGEFDDTPSAGDAHHYCRAGALTRPERKWLEERLDSWIWERRAAVEAIAEALSRSGELNANDLARLIHAEDALADFRHLYAKPVKPAPRPAPVLTLASPKRSNEWRRATCSGRIL